MKIGENWRKLGKINENQGTTVKMWGNLRQIREIQRNSAKICEIPRKSARYFLTGRLFNWMVRFSLQGWLRVRLGEPPYGVLRGRHEIEDDSS